jgi:hypothetical protein
MYKFTFNACLFIFILNESFWTLLKAISFIKKKNKFFFVLKEKKTFKFKINYLTSLILIFLK